MNIGDRVRFVCTDINVREKVGCYPPFGTHGTVINMEENMIQVKWDNNTIGDGEWWCGYKDVEVVSEATEMKSIFDIIEPALEKAGYKILDGDDDTVYVLSSDGVNFEIKVNEI